MALYLHTHQACHASAYRWIPGVGSSRMSSPTTAARPFEYTATANRIGAHRSPAQCKDPEIALDTETAGRTDSSDPADPLFAALAAGLLKSMERVAPILRFQCRDVPVHLQGFRQKIPPSMSRIDYEIMVDTEKVYHRLELLHENVRKFGHRVQHRPHLEPNSPVRCVGPARRYSNVLAYVAKPPIARKESLYPYFLECLLYLNSGGRPGDSL